MVWNVFMIKKINKKITAHRYIWDVWEVVPVYFCLPCPFKSKQCWNKTENWFKKKKKKKSAQHPISWWMLYAKVQQYYHCKRAGLHRRCLLHTNQHKNSQACPAFLTACWCLPGLFLRESTQALTQHHSGNVSQGRPKASAKTHARHY